MKLGISADSHIVAPQCYVDFIEPQYRDIAPRLEKKHEGVDTFKIHGMKHSLPLDCWPVLVYPRAIAPATPGHSEPGRSMC